MISDQFNYCLEISLWMMQIENFSTKISHFYIDKFQEKKEIELMIKKVKWVLVMLPIVGHMRSVYLSNYDRTSQQAELLFSCEFTLDRFISLQSLLLYQISSFNMFKQIILQFYKLGNLRHVKIIDCSRKDREKKTFSDCVTCILSLPKRTHCLLDDNSMDYHRGNKISIRSSSIKHLSLGIDYLSCSFIKFLKYRF